MAFRINGAIALALATLITAGAGFALLKADHATPTMSAVKTAAAEPAATALPKYAPPSAEVSATQASTAADQPDDSLVIKRILPISGPIKYGEWHWDEANVPAGKIIITVDLDARVLSIFRGGYEIGAAAVLLGTPEKPTPTGVFPIMSKYREHTSSIYDSPMPYTQRLTNGGVSLHATTVERYYASHGCVGMPNEFARKVFEATKVGDSVIITRGKMVGKGDALAAN